EIISSNYIPDAVNMIIEIKKKLASNSDKISYIEFYPFWMLTGYSVTIYYDGIPFLRIFSHNNRCVPTKKIKGKIFMNDKTSELKNDIIQIGCFDLIFLMNLITAFRMRVNFEDEKYQYHNIMTSHLIEMRNYYFKKNNKNLLDDTLFQSFLPDCVGKTMDPSREIRLIRSQ